MSGDEFARFFKALAPFCNNGWYVTLNIEEEQLRYGIFRRYTGLAGESFEDYFCNTYDGEYQNGTFIVRAESDCELALINHTNKVVISNRFYECNKGVLEDISSLASDATADCDSEKEYVLACFYKMLRQLPSKIHGTIVLVVNNEFELEDKIMSGMELSPVIDFAKAFRENKLLEEYSESEKMYSLMGLFYRSLNTDGITIITSCGKMRYFNVFYKGETPKNIKGGARKRTAYGIYNNGDIKGLLGVYFQSQDGDTAYLKRGN